MIFDTDILIWIQRGNEKAAEWVNKDPIGYFSTQTYLELLQEAENGDQQRKTQKFISELSLEVLPITENISRRAMVYIEQYGLSHRLGAGDALIAATAVEHKLPLATGNAKHFKAIKDLELKIFKP